MPYKDEDKSLVSIIASGIGGLLISGAIFGSGLWSALLVLRSASIVETIISYRHCVLLGYIYVIFRTYNKQLFNKD